jgi:hypothetical protein
VVLRIAGLVAELRVFADLLKKQVSAQIEAFPFAHLQLIALPERKAIRRNKKIAK